ncbi:hypothetical protein LEP1GSC050_3276 [Leptospira broomii serovar Hurstbridge str. 5399]|uniref:Uncharacterized protein n=1 Tax=Leptospira broomii serovar Hurstbridge str. 5399 TaxID=1049789 RepID=T0FBI3_9LEPT|nr:hypothetical protein LEP1GSC050_3276 [Leptospira broomii serovar Hurstbridge str. 5399]
MIENLTSLRSVTFRESRSLGSLDWVAEDAYAAAARGRRPPVCPLHENSSLPASLTSKIFPMNGNQSAYFPRIYNFKIMSLLTSLPIKSRGRISIKSILLLHFSKIKFRPFPI